MFKTTRRHIPKESYDRIHCRENSRSDVTGCLSGQLLEYLQERSKMRAMVSRGGSTDIRPGKRRQVAETPAEHAVQLTSHHSMQLIPHIQHTKDLCSKNLSSVKPARRLPPLDLFSKFCNLQLLPMENGGVLFFRDVRFARLSGDILTCF